MLNIPSHHFLNLYWLVILGTPDFPYTSLTNPTALSFLGNSSSAHPLPLQSSNADTGCFTLCTSLDNLIYHCHSFNYHQSTGCCQACHSSNDTNLQISICNCLLNISSQMIHRLKNWTHPIGKIFQMAPMWYLHPPNFPSQIL